VADRDVLRGQRWRHYKGGVYDVLHVGRLEETLEYVVIYRAAVEPVEQKNVWVRRLANFLEFVDEYGQASPAQDTIFKTPRFERIE
jgi:hypothetical protein